MKAQEAPDNLRVRLATNEDIPTLLDLHLASFRPEDHLAVMLGSNYVRATYRWLVHGKECYCLVADLGGKVVGVVGIADGDYTWPMFRACLPQFMTSLARSPQLLLQRRLWHRLFRQADESPAGRKFDAVKRVAQVTIVAVDAKARGLGVFPALIRTVQDTSKQRGSRAIRSGVYKFNERGRRAWASTGWAETPELETRDTVTFMYYIDPGLLAQLRELHRQ